MQYNIIIIIIFFIITTKLCHTIYLFFDKQWVYNLKQQKYH